MSFQRHQFIMPGYSDVPIGGYRSVYEWCNALVAQGHEATIVFPRYPHPSKNALGTMSRWAATRKESLKREFPTWFRLDPRVKRRFVPDAREKWLQGADATYATFFNTAEYVSGYSRAQGQGFYLVQAYEVWAAPQEKIEATYRLPLHKICVAKWILNHVLAVDPSKSASQITYGVNHEEFHVETPFENRVPKVAMLFSNDPAKGAWDGVNALERAKEKRPELQAVLYGTPQRPALIPEWIEYHQKPRPETLRRLFNESQVFLHTSWNEGWGMPPAEAMACGCAIVSAENGGVLDYLRPDETAYMSPPKDPVTLARTLIQAMENPLLAQTAARGTEDIRKLNWRDSTTRLQAIVASRIGLGEPLISSPVSPHLA